MNKLFIIGFSLLLSACHAAPKKKIKTEVLHMGAMKDVMWKGELFPKVAIDTLDNENLYAIGPGEYLKGEVLVYGGKKFLSSLKDSSIYTEQKTGIKAPFLVYAKVENWEKLDLPKEVNDERELEAYLNTLPRKQAFVFRLEGRVLSADIHIQNLAPGSIVRSPEEAHRGQASFKLNALSVKVLGFHSNTAHGIYTHHDSNIHMHLISEDEQEMGHVDAISFDKMNLWISQ